MAFEKERRNSQLHLYCIYFMWQLPWPRWTQKWTDQLLAQESQVSLHLWNRNRHVNHSKWLSSPRNLIPATNRKQVRICTDKRHLALFDDQHHNFGCLIFFLGVRTCLFFGICGKVRIATLVSANKYVNLTPVIPEHRPAPQQCVWMSAYHHLLKRS